MRRNSPQKYLVSLLETKKQTQISLNYSDMGFEVLSKREPASTYSGSETTLNEVYGDTCHLALCSRPAVWNRVRGNKGWSKRGCAAPGSSWIQIRPIPVRLSSEHVWLLAANCDKQLSKNRAAGCTSPWWLEGRGSEHQPQPAKTTPEKQGDVKPAQMWCQSARCPASSNSSAGLCKTQMPQYERTRGSTGRNTLYLKAEGQVVHRHLSCGCAPPALLYSSPCQGKHGTAYIFCRKSLLGHPSAAYGHYHTAAPMVHQVIPVSMQPPLCLLIASGSPTFRDEWAKPTRINRTPHYFSL